MRSSGATHVLEMAPAMPPAANVLNALLEPLHWTAALTFQNLPPLQTDGGDVRSWLAFRAGKVAPPLSLAVVPRRERIQPCRAPWCVPHNHHIARNTGHRSSECARFAMKVDPLACCHRRRHRRGRSTTIHQPPRRRRHHHRRRLARLDAVRHDRYHQRGSMRRLP